MIKPLLLLLSCLLVLPCLAEEKPTVEVRFLSLHYFRDSVDIKLLTGEDELLSVELSSTDLSKPYQVVKPKQWVLGEGIPDAEGNASLKPLGKAKVLDANQQLLVAIPKGDKQSDGYDLHAYPYVDMRFKGGCYRIFNFTEQQISGEIGNSRFALEANQVAILCPAPENAENGNQLLNAILNFGAGEKAKPFYSNTWRYNDQARTLLFLYKDPQSQKIRTRSIRSFIN